MKTLEELREIYAIEMWRATQHKQGWVQKRRKEITEEISDAWFKHWPKFKGTER